MWQQSRKLQFVASSGFALKSYKSREKVANVEAEEDAKTQELQVKTTTFRERAFVDKMKIKVYGGNGGAGCTSYYRDRVVVSGAPDGGTGGNGGDIILKANKFFTDLSMFKQRVYMGNPGEIGRSGRKHGRNANPYYLSVPLGTNVFEVLAELR